MVASAKGRQPRNCGARWYEPPVTKGNSSVLQNDCRPQATTNNILDGKIAALTFRQCLYNRKSKSCSPRAAATRRFKPFEGLHEPRQGLWRNTRALVFYGNPYAIAFMSEAEPG